MERILVIGCPGGGKTTFATTLGKRLGIPVHHLDWHFWKENRRPTPQDEFRETLKQLMQESRWILDGNFTKSIDIRIAEADTIILFDFPKAINLWRTFKRFLQHFGSVRPDMGGGNKEALVWKHVKYIITFPRKEFVRNVTSLAEGKNLIVLRNPRAAQDFLNSL
jgi:adenylate kinase family enzyme